MSLNCKQLKTKYEELLQEEEKFVLELEKVKDVGDVQKLRELKTRLEKNTKEIRDVLKYSGSVCDSLKRLGKMNGVNISEIKDIHYNNSGDLAGRVKIGNQWFPFR